MWPGGRNALALILVMAAVVRVGVIVATPGFQPIFDARDYERHAVAIATGQPYFSQFDQPPAPSAFRPPLYPLALAIVHVLGGAITGGRLLGALLGVATVLLAFLIADRLWGRRVAVVTGALAALFPPLALLNASLLSESLFLPLELGALLAILEYRRGRRLRWAIAAGALCGLAALTRVNGLLLALAALAGVWTVRPRYRRPTLISSLALVITAVIVAAPWTIRNTIVFGRFVGISTEGGYGLAATYNRESAKVRPAGRIFQSHQLAIFRDLYRDRSLDEAERASRLTGRALDFAGGHPGYVARALFWNTLRILELHRDGPYDLAFQAGFLQAVGDERLVSPTVLGSLYLVLVLALFGALTQLGLMRATRAPPFVWLFPVLMVLPAIAVVGLPRYRAPVDPFLVMLAAVALVSVPGRLRAVESHARQPASASQAHN